MACAFWFNNVESVFLKQSDWDDKQLSTTLFIKHQPQSSEKLTHLFSTLNFSLNINKWKTGDGNPVECTCIIKCSCDILPQIHLATTDYWSTWYTDNTDILNCSLMLQMAFNIFIRISLHLHNFKKYFRPILDRVVRVIFTAYIGIQHILEHVLEHGFFW